VIHVLPTKSKTKLQHKFLVNKSLKNVAKFKYLRIILKNHNYFNKQIEGTSNMGNASEFRMFRLNV